MTASVTAAPISRLVQLETASTKIAAKIAKPMHAVRRDGGAATA